MLLNIHFQKYRYNFENYTNGEKGLGPRLSTKLNS